MRLRRKQEWPNAGPVLLLMFHVAALAPGYSLSAAEQDGTEGPQIVFMIGEREYRTATTLREFFRTELAPDGCRATFIVAPDDGAAKHDFPGLEETLPPADLLVLSVRRRAPKQPQLAAVREHLAAGKPLVAIRTASHAFDIRGDSPAGHDQWLGFDEEVLGGKYSGHFGEESVQVQPHNAAADDPLLRGVTAWESTKLYRCELRSPAARLLLVGQRPNGDKEPVAWTSSFGPHGARVFYTSLGVDTDFQQPAFRHLLRNAVQWALAPTETKGTDP